MIKKIYLTVLILLFTINLHAIEKYNVILNGTIENVKSNVLTINNHSTEIDSYGNFRFELSINESNYYNLKYTEKIRIFLSPDDSLYITLDSNNIFKTLKFSGRGSQVNNFLVEQAIIEKQVINNFKKNFKSINSLPEREFVKRINSLRAKFDKPLKQFLRSNINLDDWFIKSQQASNLYSWAKLLLDYPRWHKRFTDKDPQLSKDYYSFLDQLDFNNYRLMTLDEYRECIQSYIYNRAKSELINNTDLKNSDNQWNTARFNVALKTFTDEKMKNHWLHQILKNQIDNFGIKNTDYLMTTFREHCTNDEFVSEIEKMYKSDLKDRKNHTIKTYKKINNFTLDAHIFSPPNFDKKNKYPCLISFHGGSWYEGKVDWEFPECHYYASKGMVTIAAEYRIYDRHGVTPLECIADAKSIIRWARENSDDLGIDPDRIITNGFSSGGHISACAGMIEKFDDPSEDMTISSAPNAMMLTSSVYDPTLDSWFRQQVRDLTPPKSISPNHNVRSGLPPCLVIHATNDSMCPFWTAKLFTQKMKNAGNRCDFFPLKGANHIFFYIKKCGDLEKKYKDEFLVSLGYLEN